MGATTQVVDIAIKDDKREAWRTVCEESREWHGSDPYSGGIHLCSLSHRVRPPHRVGTKAYSKWLGEYSANLEKRTAVFHEINPSSTAGKQIKANWGLRNRRGVKVFRFIGCAPC